MISWKNPALFDLKTIAGLLLKAHEIIQAEITSLLEKKVIEHTNHSAGEVISSIFTREKRDSDKHRVILNLSELNEFISCHHFKMDTLTTATKMLSPDCFCASTDLSDAYYSVSMDPRYRKYLRYAYNGQLFQFTCLPNGLSPGPRVFTKLLKSVLATLRRRFGIKIMAYLDDLLLLENSPEEVRQTIDIFTDLGFKISVQKSTLLPTRSIEFLGFILDSHLMS